VSRRKKLYHKVPTNIITRGGLGGGPKNLGGKKKGGGVVNKHAWEENANIPEDFYGRGGRSDLGWGRGEGAGPLRSKPRHN